MCYVSRVGVNTKGGYRIGSWGVGKKLIQSSKLSAKMVEVDLAGGGAYAPTPHPLNPPVIFTIDAWVALRCAAHQRHYSLLARGSRLQCVSHRPTPALI